ncbi:hypothetical protein QYF61_020554 [Mycteria americana]|uniref:Uncharacterized protein n=1 Tax=Mycteria americana TaxID=33587 RepID=A0AAN7S4S9_MYCAM|nr:hypothetical protein QYF61_020554 [Mycteria americana]
MLHNPFGEEIFPNTEPKPSLAQLEAISSCPMACYLGEETDTHLATTSFQVVVESDKVSPQPPFLQAKQPQLPQLLITRRVLQTLHQLRCPSLDSLQHLNVSLVVRAPKLNTGFEVQPHQCRVQGDNHFPSPAGHTIFDTSQDAIGLLGHLGTLLAHIQPAVDQHPQVFFCLATFQPLFPKPAVLHGVVVAQVQDPALGLVKPHTIGLGPSIQPVQVPLQSLPTLKQINTSAQLGVVCKLTKGALDPLIQIIDKGMKQNWPQHRALGNTACDRPPTGVNSIHLNSLGLVIQTAFTQTGCWLMFNSVSTRIPQVLFCQAAFQLAGPQHILVPGVVPSQVQDFALFLVELHEIPVGPLLQPVEVPLNGSTVIWCISHSSQFGVICKLAESTLYPVIQMINEDVKQDRLFLDVNAFLPLFQSLNTWQEHDPVPMLHNPFAEENFPNTQPKPPLAQLEAFSSCPMACYLGEETNTHLTTTSFQVAVESDKVSPQPPFLQAKQPQLPQPLLTRLVLQTLHQLRCSSLDMLQHLNVSLVVRGPKLNTGFEVWPHQCQVQGHDHFPTPAGHTISHTSQDAIGLLGHLSTLLAHIQAPLFPKPAALHGVVVTQVQDPALGLAEPHTVGQGPSIQPVQVPLQSLPTLKQINTPAQLGVAKLTEGALDPLIQIIDKGMKQNWPQHRALGNTACDRPPTGFNSIPHNSLGPAIQPVLYPAKSTPIQAMSSQFLQENAVGNEPHTYYARAPGQVGQSQRRRACCAGQELVAIAPHPLSQCVQPGGERTGNPPTCPACPSGLSQGRWLICSTRCLTVPGEVLRTAEDVDWLMPRHDMAQQCQLQEAKLKQTLSVGVAPVTASYKMAQKAQRITTNTIPLHTVRPHLEYCIQFHGPQFKRDVEKLERVQQWSVQVMRTASPMAALGRSAMDMKESGIGPLAHGLRFGHP